MNALLTIATNFNEHAINRFVKSFRQFNTNDKIIIVINQKDARDKVDYLKTLKSEFQVDWRVVDDSYIFNKYYVISERFNIFKSILRDEELRMIFMCDSRDVLFQNDPFTATNMLTFFLEPEIICNEPFNTFTIRHLDSKIFDNIKNKHIICAGTIMGMQKDVLSICNTLAENIAKIPIILNEVGNPFNFDQAILNMLVYSGAIINQFILSNNQDGIVNTIGLSQSFRKIHDGFFYTENGIRSAVVHQFDRCDRGILLQLKERGLDIEDLL